MTYNDCFIFCYRKKDELYKAINRFLNKFKEKPFYFDATILSGKTEYDAMFPYLFMIMLDRSEILNLDRWLVDNFKSESGEICTGEGRLIEFFLYATQLDENYEIKSGKIQKINNK